MNDKKSCAFDEGENQVGIGRLGKYAPGRAKRLFIEEVLVHAGRRNNGTKTGDYLLAQGMGQIIEAEEGLAKVFQVSLGEALGKKVEDYYIDTAFALGLLGKKQLARPEMAGLYYDKQVVRAQANGTTLEPARLYDDTWRYVNRIYRGSLGNHHVGVNTKDISYYAGFLKMREFIKGQLDAGVKPPLLLEYVLFGRFDPANPAHVKHVMPFLSGELRDQLA